LTRFLTVPLAVLMAACSVSYVPPPKGLPPILAPSVAPSIATSKGEAAGNVACPTTIGSSGGYTGFGAPAAEFNAGHQGTTPLIRCATDLKVIIYQLDISPGTTGDAALADAEKQLPSDLTPVYDKSGGTCRDLQFQSATLASLLGSDDPDGVVNIELESALAPNFTYNPTAVDTAVIHQQYNLHETRDCIR
jgi:hypothetical protein